MFIFPTAYLAFPLVFLIGASNLGISETDHLIFPLPYRLNLLLVHFSDWQLHSSSCSGLKSHSHFRLLFFSLTSNPICHQILLTLSLKYIQNPAFFHHLCYCDCHCLSPNSLSPGLLNNFRTYLHDLQPVCNTAGRVSLATYQVILLLKTNLRWVYCSPHPSLGSSLWSLLPEGFCLLHTGLSLCLECFSPSPLHGSHPLLPSGFYSNVTF